MADCGREEMEGIGEEEKLLEGAAVLDFDKLCSTVALQSQRGKWSVLEDEDDGFGGERFGGVLRMWEGGVLDCFDDRRIAIQTLCCPCYRFGNNMNRAGLGSSFLQGCVYMMFMLLAAFSYVSFVVTTRNSYLYFALALTVSLGTYSGFLRTRIRNKFNIMEARTLEMNNVEDGAWRGRGDTIYVGNLLELQSPPPIFVISDDPL